MKRIINITLVVLLSFSFWACEPYLDEKPDIGSAPTADQLSFDIKAGTDAFRPVLENTSQVKGIVTWDFGNGANAKGDKVSTYYPSPQTYTITMTVFTSGGSASITKEFVQTEMDYTLFTDPLMIAVSGGPDALEGKTWVIDSLEAKHLGVGPTDAYEPSWWGADPMGKAGHYLYDDEFTFKLIGFEYKIDTKGATHANGDGNAARDGLAAGYYTGVIWEDQYDKDVSVSDAARGKTVWALKEENGKQYITLSNQAAVIGYDDGNPRSYEILSWTNNSLHLRTIGGAARYHKLIPKGYVRPVVKFDLSVAAATGANSYNYSLVNVQVPQGQSITKVMWNFGDGTTYESGNSSQVIPHTYMRKGTYNVSVVVSSAADYNASQTVVVEANHPDYQEFIIDGIVMYNDFSEVSMTPMAVQDGLINILANPLVQYPNKSSKVLYFEKTNQQWANAYMQLPLGYRYDLRKKSMFKMMVYGKAGDVVLLKLENTDRGGNAWQTGTADKTYTITKDNQWEIAEFNMAGNSAGWDWTGDIFTGDITTDNRFNHDFYNVVRIMINPGVGDGKHSVYLDELAGPHVEGLKSAKIF